MPETDAENLRLGFGVLYRAARARFDYSEALAKDFTPTPLERGRFLALVINEVMLHEDAAILRGNFKLAIQLREHVRPLLEELGTIVGA